MSLLEVRDLAIAYRTADGAVPAVENLAFALETGGALGIVGESGAGKSQAALALIGLLPPGAQVSGSIRFEGRELLGRPASAWADVRGKRIAMVFQDPMTSLNPFLRVGIQIGEVIERHRGVDRAAARAESLRLLEAVHLADAPQRLRSYPHELSGGQRQRVMIAMALACRPALLLADEPTTALDVTVQAQILRLFAELRRDFGLALLLITHDLGVVAEVCERTLVMYAGRAVEQGPTPGLLAAPAHPYTRALLAARPRLDGMAGDRLFALPGHPPGPSQRPAGCAFAPRCPVVFDPCAQRPEPRGIAPGRHAACHRLPPA